MPVRLVLVYFVSRMLQLPVSCTLLQAEMIRAIVLYALVQSLFHSMTFCYHYSIFEYMVFSGEAADSDTMRSYHCLPGTESNNILSHQILLYGSSAYSMGRFLKCMKGSIFEMTTVSENAYRRVLDLRRCSVLKTRRNLNFSASRNITNKLL